MRLAGVVVAIVVVGCVRTSTERCGDFVCPEGTTCTPYADLVLCVSSSQTEACNGREEGDECEVQSNRETIAGFCRNGACLAVGCGNGRIDDPIFKRDEECDDGNRISHDGCSSTCRDEQPRVTEVYPYGLSAVTDVAVLADTASGQLTMFGGYQYGGVLSSRTWTLVDDAWRLQHTRTAPSPRRGHGAAYDQHRQCVVMYGGATGDATLADTWESDGTGWTPRSPAHSPPPNRDHAMGYDPIRRVTVMFGAVSNSGTTWEWDGADWTERIDTRAQPGAGVHHAMAFDPSRGVMVLIVESNTGVTTYELDADGWREVASESSGPPAGAQAPIAYDAVAGHIVVSADLGPVDQLWSWDGIAWTSVAAQSDGVTTQSSGMAMGPDGRVVRVGGNSTDSALTQTSATARWDGTRWLDLAGRGVVDANPARRFDYAATYDSTRRVTTLFGGHVPAATGGSSTYFADTWELGARGWSQRTTAISPSARSDHAMAYDARRAQVVLYGDHARSDGQTWLWDGTSWESRAAVSGLEPRSFTAMAYDSSRDVVVLFGGLHDDFAADTWEWDGSTWTERVVSSSPPARADHAMAYDPIAKKVIVFGGRGRDSLRRPITYSDTWEWDGTSWTARTGAAVPSGRYGHGLAWDPARARLMLVGGLAPAMFGPVPVRDVWEWDGIEWSEVSVTLPIEDQRIAATPYSSSGIVVMATSTRISTLRVEWTADTPYETCTSADHDRDGLVGCADPDCWSTCSPTCVPGASCAPSEPRCGDGACSPVETCSACPEDCDPCPAICGDGTCSAGEQCVGDCAS